MKYRFHDLELQVHLPGLHAMAKNLRLYIKSFTPITCTKLAQPDGCPGSDALHVAQQQAAARQVTGVGQCKYRDSRMAPMEW